MQRYFYYILCLYCFIAIQPECAQGDQEEKTVPKKMIHAEIRLKGCAAEMYVNDIPIIKIESPDQPFISIPVHQYLLDGTNLLELVINPGLIPSQARIPQDKKSTAGMSAEVRFVRYPVGVFTGDASGEILAQVEWIGKGDEEEFPKVIGTSCNLGPQFGRWAWQDAETITMNKSTHAETIAFVKTVYDAYASGKPDVILNLSSVYMKEISQAYPERDIIQMNKLFARDVMSQAADPGWHMLPFDATQFDFRICARGKMVECIRKDWIPIVAGKIDDDIFDYPMFLARIKGQWQIAR